MGVLAWRKPAPDPSSYEDDEAEEDEFFAGERICAPPEETRGNLALRICVVALIATGGWWLARHPQSWQGLLPTNLATSSTLMEYRTPDPVQPPVPPPETAAQAAPVPGTNSAPPLPHTPGETAAAPDTMPPPMQPLPAQPLPTVAAHPAPKEFSVSALEPPPPASDLSDPYRARAAAAGLSPDLSRVLLSRLSPADYTNARTAIDTAIAKTPENGTFVWPRQRSPELALFQIHFVPGAAPDCRRYVVSITKDRWSTTAPPMQRCGAGWGVSRK